MAGILGCILPRVPAINGANRWFPDHAAKINAFLDLRRVPSRPGGPLRDQAVVCVTGGYETAAQIEDALSSGVCDMVGLARPFCVAPSDLSGRDTLLKEYHVRQLRDSWGAR